jgi:2-polyprenyl-3-methyl-5-hydroxy-6-metoxy-1,4-benzoquinol methylase
MDALDASGIFPQDRQAFHRARYCFALDHVAHLVVGDIACGLGYGCRILKEGGAQKVIGIDSDAEAVHYATVNHLLTGISFEVADATRTPLAESSVDAITSFETIEHVPDTTGILTEFVRILRPDGKLIISSPNDWGLTDHHCHTWTPFEFAAEIAAFFDIETVWEQHSNADGRRGQEIKHWSKETEQQAECIIIVARKPSALRQSQT